jgi:dethiobiotin synthetase
MTNKKIFITGIGTDVGKTVVSAIVVEALEADYWKPIQAGDLDYSDTDKVKARVSNEKSVFYENAYALKTPASPHYAAEIDKVTIDIEEVVIPNTKNHLVIEGAGGILVPINSTETILDLIKPDYKVIVVSRHYLGSINHTLMTVEILKQQKCTIAGIIFMGDENEATEQIILQKTGIEMLGRVEEEPYFDANVVKYYADKFADKLLKL